jgi:predicted MFS family arabinose efflux permease
MTDAASRQYNRLASIFAMIVIGIMGSCMAIIMPGFLSALSGMRGLTAAQVSIIASVELAATMIATLAVAPLVATRNRRVIALVALLLIMAGNLATGLLWDYNVLAAARIVAGLGEGAVIVVMASSVAATAMPDRIFAIYIASNLVISGVVFSALRVLTAIGHLNWIFFALIALSAVAAAFLPLLPAFPPAVTRAPGAPAQATGSSAGELGTAVIGLAGTLFFFVAIGTAWPLMGQIGASWGTSAEDVAEGLAASSFVGIVCALFVSWLGTRFGRRIPLVIGSCGLIAVMFTLTLRQASLFGILCSAFVFWWVFTVPYYMGLMAEADRTGRVVSFSMAMQFGGLALGPLLATLSFKGASAYAGAIWSGLALFALAMLTMLIADFRNRRVAA